ASHATHLHPHLGESPGGGRAEVAELEVGFSEEALVADRARRYGQRAETDELCRAARRSDRHADEPRDAAASDAARCRFLQPKQAAGWIQSYDQRLKTGVPFTNSRG